MSSINELQNTSLKQLKKLAKDLGCRIDFRSTKNDLIKLIIARKKKTTSEKVDFVFKEKKKFCCVLLLDNTRKLILHVEPTTN